MQVNLPSQRCQQIYLRKYCETNGWMLNIYHHNIAPADLNRDGLHLNHGGNWKLFKNLIDNIATIAGMIEMYFR